jgi:hypothetical protein
VVKYHYGYPLWYIVFFSKFATGLNERYPELFDGDGVSSQHQYNFGRKWRSYSTIFELAEGDIEKIDRVVEEPLEKCLLFLAYKSDKNRLEGMLHRESLKNIK